VAGDDEGAWVFCSTECFDLYTQRANGVEAEPIGAVTRTKSKEACMVRGFDGEWAGYWQPATGH